MKQIILIASFVLIAAGIAFLGVLGGLFQFSLERSAPTIENFDACAKRGYQIMESYPRQCRAPGGKIFMEDIGNVREKSDRIRVRSVTPNQTVKSPLAVEGEARGFWFFEASFPVRLFDAQGNELAVTVAEAQDEWMTEEFVPFRATITFEPPNTEKGIVVLRKDNPSGLPEHDDELRIPVRFGQ
ncbi:MAG: Gmad2 immunoglobulin-like domain-containing protein [Candidatus Liptonbacteria bacterium]|nr:Gmad2 immunoglobulin-like domain-containing protein [Candidatus Liptonbacteria bacterium]